MFGEDPCRATYPKFGAAPPIEPPTPPKLWLRHDASQVETATLYELTDLGRSLNTPLAAMAEWAGASWQSVETARLRWNQLRRARR